MEAATSTCVTSLDRGHFDQSADTNNSIFNFCAEMYLFPERVTYILSASRASPTLIVQLRKIFVIYIYIYIYILYIRSYVVHVPFTRALRANVGPAG